MRPLQTEVDEVYYYHATDEVLAQAWYYRQTLSEIKSAV